MVAVFRQSSESQVSFEFLISGFLAHLYEEPLTLVVAPDLEQATPLLIFGAALAGGRGSGGGVYGVCGGGAAVARASRRGPAHGRCGSGPVSGAPGHESPGAHGAHRSAR